MVPIHKKRLLGVAIVAVAWALGAAISVLSLRMYTIHADSPPTAQSRLATLRPV
jgi:hypothetical protein